MSLATSKKPKYGNRWTEVDGIKFQSAKEARRWQQLLLLEKGGAITDLKRQFPIKCIVNGMLVCKLVADFSYYCRERKDLVFEDVKGYKGGPAYAMFKLKQKLVKACTNIDVLEI